jgi:hypothetical protein
MHPPAVGKKRCTSQGVDTIATQFNLIPTEGSAQASTDASAGDGKRGSCAVQHRDAVLRGRALKLRVARLAISPGIAVEASPLTTMHASQRLQGRSRDPQRDARGMLIWAIPTLGSITRRTPYCPTDPLAHLQDCF